MGCVAWLLAACAQSGERAPARAPSSTEAEEAPARPIATSLASDPLNEPAAEEPQHGMHHVGHRHDHSSEAASGTAAEPTIYTCPMHPEVQQPGPGECPKCGMKLVPSTKPDPKSSQQAEPAHEHAN